MLSNTRITNPREQEYLVWVLVLKQLAIHFNHRNTKIFLMIMVMKQKEFINFKTQILMDIVLLYTILQLMVGNWVGLTLVIANENKNQK